MSTITATPAPSINRTPLYVALGLMTVLAGAAIVVPNLTRVTTAPTPISVPAPAAAPRAGGPDVAERAGIAERMRAEARLDRQAKSLGNYAGVPAVVSARVPRSVLLEQVGSLHRTYAFTGTTGYSALVESQVPGSGGRQATARHTVWNDTFVPPYDDPTWSEAIQRHYFGAGAAG